MDKACFELKGSLFTLTVLQLFEDDLSLLESQLKERVKMAPGFFNHTPLVIDLHDLPEEKQDLDFFALRELLLSLSIIPVGIKGASKAVHTQLEAAGMAVLAEAKKPRAKPEPQPAPQIEAEVKAEVEAELVASSEPESDTAPEIIEAVTDSEPEASKQQTPSNNEPEPAKQATVPATKVVKQTIRSGRQVYAPGGDLIIIGSVSAGAEILADGNIHIYGTLRGRALAGVRGDHSASIFCHSLQAELISIAGIYLLSENIPTDKIGGSVQVFLEDDKLKLETMS